MRLDVRLVLRSWQSGVLSGKRSRRSFFLLSIRLFFDTKSERERERERGGGFGGGGGGERGLTSCLTLTCSPP